MGTRAHVGFKFKSGAVISSYVSGDGYTANVGRLLLNFYNDPQKALLIATLGSMDYVKPEIEPVRNRAHNAEKKQEDVIVAWHRDCGHDYEVSCDPSQKAWAEGFKKTMIRFVYVYDEEKRKWYVAEPCATGCKFYDLQKVMDGKIKAMPVKGPNDL